MIFPKKWGSKSFADFDTLYNFPDARTLSVATEEDLRELKTGFRAPYIVDAITKFNSGEINEEELRTIDTAECERNSVLSRVLAIKLPTV